MLENTGGKLAGKSLQYCRHIALSSSDSKWDTVNDS